MSRLLALSFAAFAALSSVAHAQPGMIRQDVQVTYGDLNISTEAGAHALLARIDSAAASACGSSPTFYSVYSTAPSLAMKVFAQCHNDAMARAVQSVNSPMLTQVYARNGEEYRRFAGR